MRARIGIVLGTYWWIIAQAIGVIAAISALGAIGGLSAVLDAITPYARSAMKWLPGRRPRAGAAQIYKHRCC